MSLARNTIHQPSQCSPRFIEHTVNEMKSDLSLSDDQTKQLTSTFIIFPADEQRRTDGNSRILQILSPDQKLFIRCCSSIGSKIKECALAVQSPSQSSACVS